MNDENIDLTDYIYKTCIALSTIFTMFSTTKMDNFLSTVRFVVTLLW